MGRVAIAVGVMTLALGAGTASGASGAETFRMPSGNIFCAWEHYSFAPVDLRCEIRSGVKPLPPRPKACGDAYWGGGYSMRRTGRAYVLCITDTIYDPKAKVLAYGSTWHGGGFTCTSETAGLRCTNPRGYGFFLSKEHSFAFREAAPTYGAFKTPSGNIEVYQLGVGAAYWHTRHVRFGINYMAYLTPGSGTKDNQAVVPDNLRKLDSGATSAGHLLHELGGRVAVTF